MTIYTWLVVLLLAAAFLLHGNQKNSRRFTIVAFLLLFAVMGLRDVNAFGSDASGLHGSYPITFRNRGAQDWTYIVNSGDFNIGFALLMKLVYELTDGNYQILITGISLFVVFSYMRFIRKYSPSPLQSVLCFLGLLYYSIWFDALKQAVAMAILLLAFDAVMERKPIKFILLVVFAASFHFPALIFLPAYWVSYLKIGRAYLSLLVAMLLITYLFRDQILNLMLDVYGNEDVEASMGGMRFLSNKVIIMIGIVISAAIIRPPKPNDLLYNILLMFAGISIVFQTFCMYNNIFERLADYYFHTAIIFVPCVFEKNAGTGGTASAGFERVKSIAVLLICAFSIWRFLSYMNGSGGFLPYRFFWQQ